MANDCLVTKLKGVVQNDNLPIFGKSRINIVNAQQTNKTRHIRLEFSTLGNQIECTGDIHFTDSTLTQDLGKIATGPSDQGYVNAYISAGEGKLIIPKYNLISINTEVDFASSNNFHLDPQELVYCENLRYLKIGGWVLEGSLECLKNLHLTEFSMMYGTFASNEDFSFVENMTSLETINVPGAKFPSGESQANRVHVSVIKKLTNLTLFDWQHKNCLYGSVEEVCEYQCQTRTEGTLIIKGGISLNNQYWGGDTTVTITFTSSGCSVATNQNYSGTYDKSTGEWTYTQQ
jgi:hypothetical protein